MSNRLGADSLYMSIASLVAERGTCKRAKVGALIVRDRRIISTGYVGSPPGAPHCIDEGCLIEDGHCVRTIHAEANTIAYASRSGVPIAGATLYTTHAPCRPCSQLALSAGIERVVYHNEYKDQLFLPGISWVQFEPVAWGHPFLGYNGGECLVCGKVLAAHSG